LTKWIKNILKQEEYRKPDGSLYNIYTDGLKVYTTIESSYQNHAEQAVSANIKAVQARYNRVWEGKDPWTYKANDEQKKIRKESLNNLIRQTKLYQSIKDKYMSKVFAKISAEVDDARFRDADVYRILKQEKDNTYLNSLLSRKYITKAQLNAYLGVLESPHYDELKSQWKKMDKHVRNAFSTKKKMKVYDYKTDDLITKTMTPLDSIKWHRQHMQSGMLAIEPSTGHVKAWVGGINHDVFQYDHINSNRQVGSTFKPFVYSTAIFMNGISPCWEVDDIQYSIPANDPNFGLTKKWEPANSDNKFSGQPMSLYQGLKKSKNSVSVYLMKELGNVEPVRNLAANMGIPKEKIPPYPSIALGTPELSLYDMTSAYASFANKGLYNKPVFVTRIEDKDGQVIYQSVPEQSKALPEDYNYVMVSMLKKAAEFIAPQLSVEVGGKTGTTNDYVDGWFMGITPNLVVGTWVGGEDPWIRFRSLANGQGGVMARPAFLEFIKRLENDPSTRFDTTAKFEIPEEMDVEIECEVYNKIKKSYDEDDIDEDLFDDIDMDDF
jgi:penicillin-binding protein 1A